MNYDEMTIKAFIDNQEKLLGDRQFENEEDADEFLTDCMANVLSGKSELRDFLDQEGMDVYGISDEELLEEAEVFPLQDGRILVVEG